LPALSVAEKKRVRYEKIDSGQPLVPASRNFAASGMTAEIMDNNYLKDLIDEVESRDGGLILNSDGHPKVVVLSIEKYNDLIAGNREQAAIGSRQASEDRQVAETEIQAGDELPENQPKNILITGGAGYIGSHLARQLILAGHKVTVIDNLSSGILENIPSQAVFLEGDLKDLNFLRDVLASDKFDAVMHMAASIEVEESMREPQKYYENNVLATGNLLTAMNEAGVKNVVFSSTTAVYGQSTEQPINETASLRPESPYGHTKVLAEELVRYYSEYFGFNAVIFRYFNACGFDPTSDIQATHETHLLANILKVAKGKREQITVFGTDYETSDGTCVRDYVHVLDICQAHIKALGLFESGEYGKFTIYNIGTGKGRTVLEMINAVAEVLNKMIPMEIGERREGDAPVAVADNSKIREELGFELMHSDLETIVKTSWKQISGT